MKNVEFSQFMRFAKKCIDHEVDNFHVGEGLSKAGMLTEFATFLWQKKVIAYTSDGKDFALVMPNRDGSNYLYAVWVDEDVRRQGRARALVEYAKLKSPAGLSLHVNGKNSVAMEMYKKLNFVEYAIDDIDEHFMANRPNIGGRENWL